MAIDFPATPTPGQEFQGYYWDDTKQAWRSQSTNRGSVITSATTPTGATAGDLWFNTVDGTMYVYYDDGITTQWVEIQANVDNYKTPSQNYILNGAFDIWQRGTTINTGGGGTSNYACDRWRFGNNNAANQYSISRVINTSEAPGAYAMRLTSARVDVSLNSLEQVFEYLEVEVMRNKRMTLSFWVRSSTPISFSSGIQSGTLTTDVYAGVGNAMTGQQILASQTVNSLTTWQRVSIVSNTIPNDAGQLRVTLIGNTTIANGTWIEFAGVQLEEGTIATPFRRNQPNIQAELAACQRYFIAFPSDSIDIFNPYFTVALGSGNQQIPVHFPVPMFKTPTITTSTGGTLHVFIYYPSNAGSTRTANITLSGVNTYSMSGSYDSANNGGGTLAAVYATGQNTNPIWVNAEL